MSAYGSGGRFGGYGANPQMTGSPWQRDRYGRQWTPQHQGGPNDLGVRDDGYVWGPDSSGAGLNRSGRNSFTVKGQSQTNPANNPMWGILDGLLARFGGGDAPKYTAQGEWDPESYDISELKTSPHEVIAALEPLLAEERDAGFAQTAKRFGAQGGGMSTPYANALGNVERKSLRDLDAASLQYMYEAALYEANAENARRESELDRAFGGWSQHGQWGHEGTLAEMGYEADEGSSREAMVMSMLPYFMSGSWWE